MSNTPDGSGARPPSPHHLCATTHSSVLKTVAHCSGGEWLASSSSSVEQAGEVVTAKRRARRRHWHCAAIWRLWPRNDIIWRLSRFYTRRRRRTLVVSSRDCPWSRRLLSQARELKGHSDVPTMICAKYRTTRAASGIEGSAAASVMSHDDVHQWSPVPIGLAAFSTLRSSWVSGPKSGCAACEEPIFQARRA